MCYCCLCWLPWGLTFPVKTCFNFRLQTQLWTETTTTAAVVVVCSGFCVSVDVCLLLVKTPTSYVNVECESAADSREWRKRGPTVDCHHLLSHTYWGCFYQHDVLILSVKLGSPFCNLCVCSLLFPVCMLLESTVICGKGGLHNL